MANSKKIQFIPKSEEAYHLVPPPEPAAKNMPDWWKEIPAFKNGSKPLYGSDGQVDATVKLCIPFADTLRTGYIQHSWCDIHIKKTGYNGSTFDFYSSGLPPIMGVRQQSDLQNKTTNDFYSGECVFKSQWMPKLPKGYSALITHPFNREELPFVTLSGIIDADKYFFDNDGNHPFLLKRDFEGTIPKGTPLYQIIPFKRDDWKSEVMEFDSSIPFKSFLPRSKFWGGYKNMFWSKKTYK